MTIAFMSMVAAIIAERGDLSFYAALQVYSALVLLLALLLPQRYTRGSDLAIVVGLYALAKVLETFDKPIFMAGHILSGHTLKHLAAAAAGYCILRMLQERRPLSLLPSTISIATHENPS